MRGLWLVSLHLLDHSGINQSEHTLTLTKDIAGQPNQQFYEPVLFANSTDPLGTHFIGNKDLNNDDTNISSEGSSSGARKQSRLSLSRILLSLDSNAS